MFCVWTLYCYKAVMMGFMLHCSFGPSQWAAQRQKRRSVTPAPGSLPPAPLHYVPHLARLCFEAVQRQGRTGRPNNARLWSRHSASLPPSSYSTSTPPKAFPPFNMVELLLPSRDQAGVVHLTRAQSRMQPLYQVEKHCSYVLDHA